MAAETRIVFFDANTLIRAVLGQKVRNTLEQFANSAQFFTPDVCFENAKKYLPALFEKRNLSAGEALEVLKKLTCLIDAVDANLYGIYEIEAKQRIAVRDTND